MYAQDGGQCRVRLRVYPGGCLWTVVAVVSAAVMGFSERNDQGLKSTKLFKKMRMMMMHRLGLMMLLMVSSLGYAHEPMKHDCVPPVRPVNESDDARWAQFIDEVDQFRACVNDKMQWHQDASRQHNDAARDVVDAWNEFVRTSLNAPADFPWPAEDAASPP